MGKSKLVSNTQIYLDCRKLLDAILDITPSFPRSYKFSIGSRLHDLAINLRSEISAAYINRDRAVRRLNKAETIPEAQHAIDSINSYLGCLRHGNEYNTRRKILQKIEQHCYKWIYIKGRYESVQLIKRYRQRSITIQRIRDGTY